MKINVFLALMLVYPLLTNAQNQPLSFSLSAAQDYALQHNKTLQNSKDDVKLAHEQYREALGAGLPKVDAKVDYMTNFNYEAEFSFGSDPTTPPDFDPTKFDEGDLEVLKLINGMFGSGGSTIVMKDQASANLTVSQLIFSGQYWVGLQMSKLGKQVRETSVNLTELEVKEQVNNAYYLILVTQELIQVLSENTNNLNELFMHTNNMYKSGMAEQTDVDQIKVNLSLLENSKREMERNLQLNYNMFRLVLGIDSESEIILTESLEQMAVSAESIVLNKPAFDISNNPNYKLVSVQEELGDKQVNLQKWAYGPTLVGYYSYTEKIMTSGFDLTPKNAAGLTLNLPIFAGGTKHAQLSQKKIELDKIKRNKSLLEEQLKLQENQLSYELSSAYDNYLAQKENAAVALRVYQSYQNKYRQGAVSSMELTQANSNYLQAQSNYVSAVLKLLQSKLAIDKLYNSI
ncbi:MAG: TolC family protein [Salinivirgaceae bacterium]